MLVRWNETWPSRRCHKLHGEKCRCCQSQSCQSNGNPPAKGTNTWKPDVNLECFDQEPIQNMCFKCVQPINQLLLAISYKSWTSKTPHWSTCWDSDSSWTQNDAHEKYDAIMTRIHQRTISLRQMAYQVHPRISQTRLAGRSGKANGWHGAKHRSTWSRQTSFFPNDVIFHKNKAWAFVKVVFLGPGAWQGWGTGNCFGGFRDPLLHDVNDPLLGWKKTKFADWLSKKTLTWHAEWKHEKWQIDHTLANENFSWLGIRDHSSKPLLKQIMAF